MKNILIIAKKELRGYFFSPIAYVVFAMFLVLAGYFFTMILLISNQASLEGVAYNIVITFLFLIPLMTMRLFAEERKLGTLEILMSKPIRDTEVVLGKFLAALVLFTSMLASTLVYVGILVKYGRPDMGPIYSTYLGMFLVGAAFIAIGIFVSTLSENQVISAVIAFAILLLFWILSWISGQVGTSEEGLFSYLSLSTHYEDFIKGVIDLKDVVYYLSFIVFFLFATVKTIGVRKWK